MTASGASSIINYQCGTPQLIGLYESLVHTPGVFGARFSGAGFGGSCMALVESAMVEEVIERVSREYEKAFPEDAANARFIASRPAGGAGIVATGASS